MECLVAPASALVMITYAGSVQVDPLDRVGQVSGLAALQFAFAVVALVSIVSLTGARLVPRWSGRVTGLVAASLAGAGTGLIAGGILIALDGTPWGLGANVGDAGRLAARAWQLMDGSIPELSYPPAYVWTLAGLSTLTDAPPGYVLKILSILTTGMIGPVGYLAWRTISGPVMALLFGVIAALPLVDPHKPFTNLMLVVMVPLLVLATRGVREAPKRPTRWIVLSGSGIGALFGLVALVYSGWFVWSAIGASVLFVWAIPWSEGRRAIARAAAYLGVAAAGFVLVAGIHVIPLLLASSHTADTYVYFDVLVEPSYIAAWRGDLPGKPGLWPPFGELGGVGLFSVVLAAGLGFSVARSWHRPVVPVATFLLVGAWLARHKLASEMFATGDVQLWPRTTAEILYCLLILTVVAVSSLGEFLGSREYGGKAVAPLGLRSIGALAAIAFVLASAGSSMADRYMPAREKSTRGLAWEAHTVRLLDGSCPRTAPPRKCTPRLDPQSLTRVDEQASP